MIELPLIFTSGILGSAHCIGMCGPFALTIAGTARTRQHNLARQAIYSLGRIMTYSFLGAMAGFAGMRLAHAIPTMVNVPALLAVAAGLLLLYVGLGSTGVIRRSVTGSQAPCLGGTILGTFIKGYSLRDVFLAGLFTGFLPCGLVYAFLSTAAASTNMFHGTVIMAVFGMGTIPVMVATGLTGSLFSVALRKRLFAVAAWCVVLAGVATLYRGIAFFAVDVQTAALACPWCD